jgi:hypothetical protein
MRCPFAFLFFEMEPDSFNQLNKLAGLHHPTTGTGEEADG